MGVIPTLRRLPPPGDPAVPKEVYKVDEKVWLGQDSRIDVIFTHVLAPRWNGPYLVKERLSEML